MNNSLNLFKILSGVSKTLNIAKNVIPIYKDTKPLVVNAKNIYKSLKNNKIKLNSKVSNNNILNLPNNKPLSSNNSSSNKLTTSNKSPINHSNPNFFL